MNSPTPALTLSPTEQSIVDLNLPNITASPEPIPEPPRELSPFEQRAIPMIERGIPVIPLLPATKIAFLSNWTERASLDLKQIVEWGELDPNLNAACVAYAKPGGVWFFEVDNPEVLGMIEKTVKIPKTFTVSSSPGKAHFYFDQTDASIGMGNLQGKDEDGKESWSARVDNRYVVAAGSIHPTTGKAYTITDHAALVPAPKWLVEWLKDNAFNSSKNPEGARVNASPDGPPIPRGSHDNELFRSACLLRNAGMGYEQIRDNLIMICEQRCLDHGADYVEMCEKKAKQACKYPVGKASSIPVMGSSAGAGASAKAETPDVSNWRSLFRNISEMEQGEIDMVITGVLQEGTCFLDAGPGHGKTLLALSLAKAITLGQPLFGIPEYIVKEPRNVIYLIPESGDKAFRKRCEVFGLPKDDRFMARTISSGGPLALTDPLLLKAVHQKKPVVFLDTTSRFIHGGDENSSAENRMLVNDVIALRAAGAVAVVLLHHAKKAATEKREGMTLENMLRGTSDFGAMCDSAFGLRVDDHLYSRGAGPMELELVNLKDRERLGGLTSIRLAATYKKHGALQPASYIDERGDFHPVDFKETKDRTRETLVQLVQSEPMVSVEELCEATNLKARKVREMLKSLGWHVVAGGPDKRSPWHKDEGRPCPYEEAKKKGKKGVVDFGESEPVFKPPVRVN
jgi:hypothetical protein